MLEGMTVMEIIKLLWPLIIIDLGLKVFSLILIIKKGVGNLNRWAWGAIVLLFSTFGPIAFLLFGRKRY